MLSNFFNYQSSSVHYIIFGEGAIVTFCFHGYGESAESFLVLQPYIHTTHTFIAIDFPYHGKTKWKEGENFTPQQLQEIMTGILVQQNISTASFTLMGFSMGGRVALQLLQIIPQKINKILLIAPDGMKINPWYWLATQTKMGNRFFRYTMQNPYLFFNMMKLANKTNLINQSIFKFTHHYLDEEKVRMDLYQRWTCMRKFKPALHAVKKNIVQQSIQVRLLYGRFDKIIQYKNAATFLNGIEVFVSLHIIPSGHQLLNKRHAHTIVQLLNQ